MADAEFLVELGGTAGADAALGDETFGGDVAVAEVQTLLLLLLLPALEALHNAALGLQAAADVAARHVGEVGDRDVVRDPGLVVLELERVLNRGVDPGLPRRTAGTVKRAAARLTASRAVAVFIVTPVSEVIFWRSWIFRPVRIQPLLLGISIILRPLSPPRTTVLAGIIHVFQSIHFLRTRPLVHVLPTPIKGSLNQVTSQNRLQEGFPAKLRVTGGQQVADMPGRSGAHPGRGDLKRLGDVAVTTA